MWRVDFEILQRLPLLFFDVPNSLKKINNKIWIIKYYSLSSFPRKSPYSDHIPGITVDKIRTLTDFLTSRHRQLSRSDENGSREASDHWRGTKWSEEDWENAEISSTATGVQRFFECGRGGRGERLGYGYLWRVARGVKIANRVQLIKTLPTHDSRRLCGAMVYTFGPHATTLWFELQSSKIFFHSFQSNISRSEKPTAKRTWVTCYT